VIISHGLPGIVLLSFVCVVAVDLDVAVLGQYAMADHALGAAVTADVRLWILDALCSAEVENTADE
jgi:hypothetical protein